MPNIKEKKDLSLSGKRRVSKLPHVVRFGIGS